MTALKGLRAGTVAPAAVVDLVARAPSRVERIKAQARGPRRAWLILRDVVARPLLGF